MPAEHYKEGGQTGHTVWRVVISMHQARQVFSLPRILPWLQGVQQAEDRLVHPLTSPVTLRMIRGCSHLATPIQGTQLLGQVSFKCWPLVSQDPLWAPKGPKHCPPQHCYRCSCRLVSRWHCKGKSREQVNHNQYVFVAMRMAAHGHVIQYI